jgi:hypothetical protein
MDITGTAVGAGVGFLMGGPPGAVVGALAGSAAKQALIRVGSELTKRFLGPREKQRVGATTIYAASVIQRNLKEGQKLRNDDFFEENVSGRSPADEILEGVLLAAQREAEEKKLEYYGNLLGNLAFHPEMKRPQMAQLMKLAQDLSYRQLCILSLLAQKERFPLMNAPYRDRGPINKFELVSLLPETMDLYNRGMVHGSGEALLGPADINPSKLVVQGHGTWLLNLMELTTIPEEEVIPIYEVFSTQ